VPAFRSELLSFPAGKHDDQVDALGLVGQLLDRILPGQHPKAPEIKKFDTGYRVVRPVVQLEDWRRYRDMENPELLTDSQCAHAKRTQSLQELILCYRRRVENRATPGKLLLAFGPLMARPPA
jgi:hypothetical protein